ncbi:2-dehydropantoate 2-reductase [Paenibacillus sp. N1-5-1-14]|uniref:2-dehydropantoate 2-reductase n=1 Tax=Paenibacillus radicibacter TaxID=2972488 RepID=UPI002158EBAE|nr:2-dehydropantoate 2-reductase [Paenibacillus radicibacter]MCR8641941.1 2-dehydropantoate 2-reductase [Paenibacillus radicibacter]
MKLLIIGAGSIGMLLTAKIAPYCEQLTLVTRTEEQAAQLCKQGLQLGDQIVQAGSKVHFQAIDSLGVEQDHVEWDYIVLTVKQGALEEELLIRIASLIGVSTKIVCYQNGMGHIERISDYVDPMRIVVAVTTEGALRSSQTAVKHTGHGVTFIGYASSNLHEQSKLYEQSLVDFAHMLQLAGFNAETTETIMDNVWGKVVINSIINPLTAILDVNNGMLIEHHSSRNTMRQLFEEALLVAGAEGVQLDEVLWEQVMEVCRRTAGNISSMRQDLLARRLTEIDYINGALLQVGEKHGIELPVHATMYNIVKAKEWMIRSGG